MNNPTITVPLDGLFIGCDCGCSTNIRFTQFKPGEPWFVYVTDDVYPVRWGPFRRNQPVQIELVLERAATVDALIAALQKVRESFGDAGA